METGWLRKVRTIPTGGRPEALYRATEQALIDTETWRTIPISIRDAFTVMLLEELGTRVAEAAHNGPVQEGLDCIARFRALTIDEAAWCTAHEAIEHCFRTLGQEQIDAKIRLETSREEPRLMIVNLAAFEAPEPGMPTRLALPKVERPNPPDGWPQRIGKVFSDPLDMAIIHELNRTAMTPTELQATLGGSSSQRFLRKCKRLTDLGWAVNVNDGEGRAHGAHQQPGPGGDRRSSSPSHYRFRAAAPRISELDILGPVPPPVSRGGQLLETFRQFLATSIAAIDAGTFNARFDRHLTTTPLLLDRVGWRQVMKAIQGFDETLVRLGADARGGGGQPKDHQLKAAFLLSTFEAPHPKVSGTEH